MADVPHEAPGPLLEVAGLTVEFASPMGSGDRRHSSVRPVDDVSLAIGHGEAFGLVGESGSGKTTTARAILRLVPTSAGSVRFGGRDWLSLRGRALRRARREMQAVFQDPYLSLDPYMSVAANISEPLITHGNRSTRKQAGKVASGLLAEVGIPASHLDGRPRELSGGQRQRVAIARALSSSPRLIVCDEPLSALDVSVQAQIINLLQEIRARTSVAYLFIGHDLSVVRYLCDRVAVMYAGKIVEVGTTEDLFSRPRHPYTHLLLSVVPEIDDTGRATTGNAGPDGTAEPPSLRRLPTGCRFHPRCPFATEICCTTPPLMEDAGSAHQVACHHWSRIAAENEASQPESPALADPQ